MPFNKQFTEAEQDKELMTTLTQELPGILNWTIEGCLRWQTEGLIAPQSVTASVTEYRIEMDTVCSFVTEECIVASHERIQVGSLYQPIYQLVQVIQKAATIQSAIWQGTY